MSDVGDEITKTFTFNVGSTPTDPDTVEIIHRKPDLTETVYEFGVDSEVANPSEGVYTITLRLVDYRRHYFRVVGTGTVTDSQELFEDVTESQFLEPIPE